MLGSPCALASAVDEGGSISDPRAADFLFSCDASHPDTLRYLKATGQCLFGPDEPGVGDGSRGALRNIDDRNRLERSKFSALDGGWGAGRGYVNNFSPQPCGLPPGLRGFPGSSLVILAVCPATLYGALKAHHIQLCFSQTS